MKKISDCLKENFEIEYRVHSLQRMFEREITESDAKYLLVHGDIVESCMKMIILYQAC